MKAKSLHFSKSGVVQPIASEIGRVYQCVCDKIPPAYPCEGEKIIFIGAEMNGHCDKAVEAFCKDLTPARGKNVAFYVVNGSGNTAGLDNVRKTVEANGVHFVGDPFSVTVKGGLFKKACPTEEQIAQVLEWAKNIIENELSK